MSKLHKHSGEDCVVCADVERYVGFVAEFGIDEALKMQKNIAKNKKKWKKIVEKEEVG